MGKTPIEQAEDQGWDNGYTAGVRNGDRRVQNAVDQAWREIVALFETIEAMYPELREVYWRGKDWQALKTKFTK